MEIAKDIFGWITQNPDTVIFFLMILVGGLRLTAWGRANAEALDKVVEIIEKTDALKVKGKISKASMSRSAGDVLDDKIAKHNPGMEKIKTSKVFARELAKTVGIRLEASKNFHRTDKTMSDNDVTRDEYSLEDIPDEKPKNKNL